MARRKSARASLGETRVPAVGPRSKAQAELPLRGSAGTAASEHHDKWLPQVHEAFRYDAFPPWTDPDTGWYYCDTCGDRLTGAGIKASVIVHVVATTRPITSTGRRPTVHTRYGGVAPAATEERSAVPDV